MPQPRFDYKKHMEACNARPRAAVQPVMKVLDSDDDIISLAKRDPSAMSRSEWHAEICKRAAALRQPGQSHEQSFTNFITRDPDGQALFAAHQRAGRTASPSSSSIDKSGGAQVRRALMQKIEVGDPSAQAQRIAKMVASALVKALSGSVGMDNTRPAPASDQTGEGGELDALIDAFVAEHPDIERPQATVTVLRTDAGIRALNADRDARIARATASIAIPTRRSDTRKSATDGQPSAWDQLQKLAAELRKTRPELTPEGAFTTVYTDRRNRELAQAHREQEMQRQLGA
jgi:hypothetical protein